MTKEKEIILTDKELEEKRRLEMYEAEKRKFKSDIILIIIASILTAAFTAGLTSYGTYFFWGKQNLTTEEQRLLDTKIGIFEKFSNTSSKMMYYSEFMFKAKMHDYKIQTRFSDSLKKEILNEDQLRAVLQIVEKKYPLEYSKGLEGYEFSSQFNSHLNLAKIVFSENLGDDLDTLMYTFTEPFLRTKIQEGINSGQDLQNVHSDEVYLQCRIEQMKLSQIVLSKMFNEIKQKK
jgi:hypothetical protein